MKIKNNVLVNEENLPLTCPLQPTQYLPQQSKLQQQLVPVQQACNLRCVQCELEIDENGITNVFLHCCNRSFANVTIEKETANKLN